MANADKHLQGFRSQDGSTRDYSVFCGTMPYMAVIHPRKSTSVGTYKPVLKPGAAEQASRVIIQQLKAAEAAEDSPSGHQGRGMEYLVHLTHPLTRPQYDPSPGTRPEHLPPHDARMSESRKIEEACKEIVTLSLLDKGKLPVYTSDTVQAGCHIVDVQMDLAGHSQRDVRIYMAPAIFYMLTSACHVEQCILGALLLYYRGSTALACLGLDYTGSEALPPQTVATECLKETQPSHKYGSLPDESPPDQSSQSSTTITPSPSGYFLTDPKSVQEARSMRDLIIDYAENKQAGNVRGQRPPFMGSHVGRTAFKLYRHARKRHSQVKACLFAAHGLKHYISMVDVRNTNAHTYTDTDISIGTQAILGGGIPLPSGIDAKFMNSDIRADFKAYWNAVRPSWDRPNYWEAARLGSPRRYEDLSPSRGSNYIAAVDAMSTCFAEYAGTLQLAPQSDVGLATKKQIRTSTMPSRQEPSTQAPGGRTAARAPVTRTDQHSMTGPPISAQGRTQRHPGPSGRSRTQGETSGKTSGNFRSDATAPTSAVASTRASADTASTSRGVSRVVGLTSKMSEVSLAQHTKAVPQSPAERSQVVGLPSRKTEDSSRRVVATSSSVRSQSASGQSGPVRVSPPISPLAAGSQQEKGPSQGSDGPWLVAKGPSRRGKK